MSDDDKMNYTGITAVVLRDEFGREWSIQLPVTVALGAKESDPEKAKALAERACLKAMAMAGDEARAYIITNRRALDITAELNKEPLL